MLPEHLLSQQDWQERGRWADAVDIAVRRAMLYISSRARSLQSGTWHCDAAVGPGSLLPTGRFAFQLRLSSL